MRLIDADEVKNVFQKYGATNDFEAVLDNIKTVDAVKVVSCKECESAMFQRGGYIRCKELGCEMNYDDFCSYGKRMEVI